MFSSFSSRPQCGPTRGRARVLSPRRQSTVAHPTTMLLQNPVQSTVVSIGIQTVSFPCAFRRTTKRFGLPAIDDPNRGSTPVSNRQIDVRLLGMSRVGSHPRTPSECRCCSEATQSIRSCRRNHHRVASGVSDGYCTKSALSRGSFTYCSLPANAAISVRAFTN